MQSDTYIFRMDGVAVRLARLKKEAQREWRRKWRQAAPSTAAEWKALAGGAPIGLFQIALILAFPVVLLVRRPCFLFQARATPGWGAGLVGAFLYGRAGLP